MILQKQIKITTNASFHCQSNLLMLCKLGSPLYHLVCYYLQPRNKIKPICLKKKIIIKGRITCIIKVQREGVVPSRLSPLLHPCWHPSCSWPQSSPSHNQRREKLSQKPSSLFIILSNLNWVKYAPTFVSTPIKFRAQQQSREVPRS